MVKQALRVSDAKCIRALAVGLMLQLGAATAGVSRDSFAIPQGDAVRGESIVTSRQLGLCLLCHSAPAGDPRVQGNLAPSLAGAGSRSSAVQLRQRIANARSINPDSIMPSYSSTDGLNRVAPAWVGQPILSPQQIEDVVAYLQTLRE
jgi:sulfur-oxidizing protein SoxX